VPQAAPQFVQVVVTPEQPAALSPSPPPVPPADIIEIEGGNPRRRQNSGPVQPVEQGRIFHRSQLHHTIHDGWPAKAAVLQLFPNQHRPAAIPEQNLHPVRTFRPPYLRNHQGGAGHRHRLAVDIQSRTAQHGHRRDHSRSEAETCRVNSTNKPR